MSPPTAPQQLQAQLARLWQDGSLCDVALITDNGQPDAPPQHTRAPILAHKCVLAAASGYFRAYFLGAGAAMRRGPPSEGCAPLSSHSHPLHSGGAEAMSAALPGCTVVRIPACVADTDVLRLVLAAIYDGNARQRIDERNLEPVLQLASFLDVPAVLAAAVDFMQAALSPTTAVPLLILAARYSLLDVKAEVMAWIGRRFSRLCSRQPGVLPMRPPFEHPRSSDGSGGDDDVDDDGAGADSPRLQLAHSWPRSPAPVAGLQAHHQRSRNSTHHAPATSTVPAKRRRSSPLCELPKDLLLELLRSDDLGVECEQDVLQAVVDWVAHDVASRLPDLPSLLASCVRVEQICQPLLRLPARADDDPATATAAAAAQALLDDAAGAAQQPHRALPLGVGRPRPRQPTGLLAAGGHDAAWRSLKSTEVFDPVTDTWAPGPPMPSGLSFAAAGRLLDDVVVVGGTPHWTCVSCLPADHRGHWRPGPSLAQARAHAGVVAVEDALYVLGGRAQVAAVQQVLPSVECLVAAGSMDTGEGCGWRPGPDMTTPRTALAAAAVRGAIYALGGQTAKTTLRSVEWLDPGGGGRWLPCSASLPTERKYAAATALGGRVYLVGGMDESRTRSAAVEAFDPREGKWQHLAPLRRARSSAGLAALAVGAHGRLYAVGGSAPGDHVHSSVEVYLPEADAWVEGPALAGCARSGLALCGVGMVAGLL